MLFEVPKSATFFSAEEPVALLSKAPKKNMHMGFPADYELFLNLYAIGDLATRERWPCEVQLRAVIGLISKAQRNQRRDGTATSSYVPATLSRSS